ncbi:MAG: LCP family protein, partial [Lachnospiraceae bacterium]|nr:LCP family protein [Lachnospiraceae bacterium]
DKQINGFGGARGRAGLGGDGLDQASAVHAAAGQAGGDAPGFPVAGRSRARKTDNGARADAVSGGNGNGSGKGAIGKGALAKNAGGIGGGATGGDGGKAGSNGNKDKKWKKEKGGNGSSWVSKLRWCIVMVLVECLTLFVIYSYAKIARVTNSIQQMAFELSKVENKSLTAEDLTKMQEGYWLIAVFGVDSRGTNVGVGANADVNMICCINRATGEVRLVSVFRDTYLNINDGSTYNKINAAYAKGGPEQALYALNKNLDLNITDYITFNWKAVAEGINILGGVDLEISKAEFRYINSFITETVKATNVPSVHLKSAGENHLDGVQAVAYGRLRLMDTDYARTERQRKVIEQAFLKAKSAGYSVLNNILVVCMPQVMTNLTFSDLTEVALNVSKYHMGETTGFPMARGDANMGSKGACVIPQTLESNVKELHRFLFDTEDYEPTQTVKTLSAKISSDSGMYREGTVVGHVSTEGYLPKSTTSAAEEGGGTGSSKGGSGTYETDGDGNRVYETDADGNRVYETDADGNRVYETDADGNRVYETDADGNRVYETDADGNIIGDTDPPGTTKPKPPFDDGDLYPTAATTSGSTGTGEAGSTRPSTGTTAPGTTTGGSMYPGGYNPQSPYNPTAPGDVYDPDEWSGPGATGVTNPAPQETTAGSQGGLTYPGETNPSGTAPSGSGNTTPAATTGAGQGQSATPGSTTASTTQAVTPGSTAANPGQTSASPGDGSTPEGATTAASTQAAGAPGSVVGTSGPSGSDGDGPGGP